MIFALQKNIFNFSQLVHFRPQTQKILTPFLNNNNFPLQFHEATLKANFFLKLFHTRNVADKFKYILKYIEQCSSKSSEQNQHSYDKIQKNLKHKIQFLLKTRKQKVIIHQCQIQRLQWLQETKVYGVFMHRFLNLSKQSYSTQVTKRHQIKYRLKNNLKNESQLNEVNSILEKYNANKFQKFYFDDYYHFQKNDYILREIIRIRANVKAQIIKNDDEDNKIRMGYQYPTQHILQLESIEQSYQKENYLITDIDCFMSGNNYFQK